MFRKYAYLLALARERHFGRAAAACRVSQPTLSNAIRQLEEELQVPIVERGRNFVGFTPEGLKILDHARRILAEHEDLQQELAAMGQGLHGHLRLGLIPTALPLAGRIIAPFAQRFDRIAVTLLSSSSIDIQRGLNDFELDGGITYLDNEPLSGVRMLPLYTEHYVLLTREAPLTEGRDSIGWADAAQLALCLLTPDMQNRRIVEQAFRQAGCDIRPRAETNSLLALFNMVRHGSWSSILPVQFLSQVPIAPPLKALALTAPVVANLVGLVHADREPPSPLARALASVLVQAGLPADIAAEERTLLERLGLKMPASFASA